MKIQKYTIVAIWVFASGFCYAQQPKTISNAKIENQNDVLLLTSDQEQSALGYLNRNYPARFREVNALREARPKLYRQELSRAFREMRFSENLKEEDPERYNRLKEEKELEIESQRLAKKYQEAAGSEEKAQIEKDLKQVLEKAFESRQRNRKDEIAKLEEKLAELKKRNDERLANREEIIELRLHDLLDKKTLSW